MNTPEWIAIAVGVVAGLAAVRGLAALTRAKKAKGTDTEALDASREPDRSAEEA